MLLPSSTRPRPPVTSAPQIPSAEAVRRSALEASWRRDKRVARRRLFWRWALWYVRRFSVAVLVVLALVLAVMHFSDRWLAWSHAAGPPIAAPAKMPAVEPATPTVAAAHPSEDLALADAPDWIGEPVPSHAVHHLGIRAPGAAPAPSRPTDTLPLKPETRLHSKEP